MADITAAAVKALRERTDLPMMECKKALVEADGDFEKAIAILKEQFKKIQVKRADNATEEGRIFFAAKADGSEADAPRLLGTATRPLGYPLSPDGDRLLLQEDGVITVARIDQADSQRRITAPVEGTLAAGAWTPDGQRIVFLSGSVASHGAQGALFVVEADAESATGTPLHAETFSVSRLAAVAPAGDAAVVKSTHGADHSLYLVPLDAAHSSEIPSPITPVDDVGERFLGFLPSK